MDNWGSSYDYAMSDLLTAIPDLLSMDVLEGLGEITKVIESGLYSSCAISFNPYSWFQSVKHNQKNFSKVCVLTYEGRYPFEATYHGLRKYRNGTQAKIFVSVDNKITHYIFSDSTCVITAKKQ